MLPYRILTAEDLAAQQKKLIGEAIELLNVEALPAKVRPSVPPSLPPSLSFPLDVVAEV